MNLNELKEKLSAKLVTESFEIDSISGGFVGDLLSVVMGRAQESCIWVTIQSHINIVAVATLVGMSVIVVCEGYEVDEDAIAKANEEEIPILSTSLSEYEVCEILVKEGIRG